MGGWIRRNCFGAAATESLSIILREDFTRPGLDRTLLAGLSADSDTAVRGTRSPRSVDSRHRLGI